MNSFKHWVNSYYIDISRNFNQFSVMGKLQYIQGIVEKRFTVYAEVGYNLPNGNIKLYVEMEILKILYNLRDKFGVTTTFISKFKTIDKFWRWQDEKNYFGYYCFLL